MTMSALRYKQIMLIVALAVIAALVHANLTVTGYRTFTRATVDELPKEKACLVLGSSKHLSNGDLNLFYQYRIEAARNVYAAGKCSQLVVSGDNRRNDYNEPEEMKKSLIALGVPADAIHGDYAGGRTLDSVLRFRYVFGQTSGIVVSQEFHNERAIYLARNHGMTLTGYNAREVDAYNGFRTKVREIFSRAMAVADIEILHSKARHYGPRIAL